MTVVVERDISVKGGELESSVGDGHDLGGVEDETHIVEGRGYVSSAGDVAFAVLVFESCF